MTRVFVLAGIRLYREGLAHVLRNRIEVIGMAATWEEAAASIVEQRPQIVLLELTTTQGFDAVRHILALEAAPKIVALGVAERRGGAVRVRRGRSLGLRHARRLARDNARGNRERGARGAPLLSADRRSSLRARQRPHRVDAASRRLPPHRPRTRDRGR